MAMNKTNQLMRLFEKQKLLQRKLNNDMHTQEYINIMVLAAIDELMEALRETPWKPWKKQQQLHQDNFKEELVDVWHFLINLSLASGMDADELFSRFINKNRINHTRQKEGY